MPQPTTRRVSIPLPNIEYGVTLPCDLKVSTGPLLPPALSFTIVIPGFGKKKPPKVKKGCRMSRTSETIKKIKKYAKICLEAPPTVTITGPGT